MKKANEKLSIIDLIDYYEPGPVLKERTPDLNRTSFYPGDGELIESSEPPAPGKKITSSIRRRQINKQALGLTDVPIHGTPGNTGAFRGRDEYAEEDFEAQFRTGFGGPSELDNFLEKEDKPSTNISRKLDVNKETKRPGVLGKMSFYKSELSKLAKALEYRGQRDLSAKVLDISFLKSSQLSEQAKMEFEEYWDKYNVSSRLREAKADPSKAFYRSTFASGPLPYQEGTDEELMLAACFYRPDEIRVQNLFKKSGEGLTRLEQRSVHLIGERYSNMSLMEIIRAENRDEKFVQMCGLMLTGTVGIHNFKPIDGKFRDQTPASTMGAGGQRTGVGRAQKRGYEQVQNMLNKLYHQNGVLASSVEGGMIRGTSVRIPLEVDGIFGPQTSGAYKAATGEDLSSVTPSEALQKLLLLRPKEKPSEARTGEKVVEEAGGKGKPKGSVDVVSDGSIKFMTQTEFAQLYHYIRSPQYAKQVVGIGKNNTVAAGNLVVMFNTGSVTVAGKKTERPSSEHMLVMPLADRGEIGIGGPDGLTSREGRGLVAVIKRTSPEDLDSYKDILRGSLKSQRTGLFAGKKSRERGLARQERGQAGLTRE